MKIQKLDIRILVDDVAGPSGTLGEAGFSAFVKIFFIDSTYKTILFDTGPSPVSFLNNIRKLEIDLTTIDAIVLSHGHWDHVGGLKEAITRTKNHIPVICHPQTLLPKIFQDKDETFDVGINRFTDSIDDLKAQANIITTTAPYKFAESVMTTGEIPQTNNFETLTGDLVKIIMIKNGESVPDKLEEDLSLVFHLADDSVVILAGCCHAGIVNTASLATKLTGSKKIVGIIGGLHLIDASANRLSRTGQELIKYPIKKIAPCHCSGLKGKFALFTAFGERFQEIDVAATLSFECENV
ncbi:MAG: MBL fold metallo-hydrolase [Candidatus Hodarchaeota archaeon]